MAKLIGILFTAALIAGFSVVLAQKTSAEVTEAVNLDENVQAEDLGISEPTLLPDSPFYFLKNWSRGIRSFFTFNPIAKTELESKFTNEKLVELKKMIEEKKNAKAIEKANENYQEGVEKVKEKAEKIKEKAKDNPKIESFLDKYTKHQILHQKILEKLETQVPPEVFEKIKEARERHLERFGEVMTKLEDRMEEIKEKLEEKMEEIKGSEYKDFKNLEILKELEEKVPEKAKEAIENARENILEKLQDRLEKMSPEKQEQFKEYIENISGVKEKQLEILDNLKTKIKERPETPEILQLKEKLEEILPESSPVPSPGCSLLWWYDNEHQYCQQKTFCGFYMYLGLYTFETKEECEAALKKEEVEGIIQKCKWSPPCNLEECHCIAISETSCKIINGPNTSEELDKMVGKKVILKGVKEPSISLIMCPWNLEYAELIPTE